MTEDQERAALEMDLWAKEHNEQLLKSLTVEEKHRQFDALIARLDGSRDAPRAPWPLNTSCSESDAGGQTEK